MMTALVADVLSGSTDTEIIGTVYSDSNSDGHKNGDDNGLSGWTVYLDLDGSGTRNTDAAGTMEPAAVTNVDGDFTINRLVPGTYRVSEVVQSGWDPTATVSREVTVAFRQKVRTDFFNFAGGDIEGTVWNDLDQDGVRAVDGGTGEYTEPGLPGWTVFVDVDNSNDLSPGDPQTTTDGAGHYYFANLPPGDYEVYQELPAGWEMTGATDIHQTASVVRHQVGTVDFSNASNTSGSLVGVIWSDENFNGVRDQDATTGEYVEPGLAGWTVFVDLNWNDTLDAGETSITTDKDGQYRFASLNAGSYRVAEVLQDGWNLTSGYDLSWSVDVFAGATTTAPDFSNFTAQNGAITGTIWNDRFRDGSRDVSLTGEFLDPGLAGWTVYLDLNRNLLQDAGEPSAVTDAAGGYTFSDLQVGEYDVAEIVPSGWETTLGYDDRQTAFVFSGTTTVAGDFANFNVSSVIPGTVSGTIWNDLNGNGVRDADGSGAFTDPGLTGRTVYVDLNGNRVLDGTEPSTTTGAGGSYTITGVTPGTITIVNSLPTGWLATAPTTGAVTYTLRNAGALTGVDFGTRSRQEASILGAVFNDANANGTRDAGEKGISGVTVWLDLNDNSLLDTGEPQTVSAVDQFFTPSVDESGNWEFTHLAAGTYRVRVQVPDTLSATPAGARSFQVTMTGTETHSGLDTAARYRRCEIHGTRYSDDNGSGSRDAGEAGVAGATVYLDLDRDNVHDVGEPSTTTAADGSYAFTDLSPGAYIVRDVIDASHEHTYPTTTGGTLWPSGTSNAAVGNVTPTSITGSLATGEHLRQNVSITLPGSGALTSMVDVFLLFDDTGSFTYNSPIVRAAFPDIITSLTTALPGTDLGFGVGRFEEYGNFAWEYSTGRPFVLNQPIVAASTTGYMGAIQSALDRTTPGYGGDGPETDIEALYQLVTGLGFDGNNNGSVLDSGPAGPASTQLTPGDSGDVPSFASFVADPTNGVLPAAGSVGGGGFRAGALPIILTATDIGFAYQPKGETTVTGVGGVSLPVSSLTLDSRPSTPFDSGAGLQETVTALNALGALVIGIGTNPEPTLDPRQGLSALSKLTGAVNRSTATISNGTANPIAPGDPLYFQISSGFATSVAEGVVNAIQNAATAVAVDVTLRASDPRVTIINHTGTVTSVGAGQSATFDVEFVGDGIPHRFDLQFVRAGTGVVLGSIPVVLGTPVPGDSYSFEDCDEGEVHHSVDFASRLTGTVTSNLAPTNLGLSAATIAENQPVGTTVGTLSTTDPNAGDTFTYSLVSGATSAFSIVGNQLRSAVAFNFESQSSYSVTVRTTDSGGLTFDKAFTISVTDVNEAPTNVSLSGQSIDENRAAATAIGTLSSTDPDAGDSFTYSVVSGDTSAFSIVGSELRSAISFDYETKSSYSVTIRTTDAGGASYDRVFTISVNDLGGLPATLTLPAAAVAYTENAAAQLVNSGSTVVDPDTANFAGGNLAITFASGRHADDRLAIVHAGTAAGQIGLSGSNVLYGGQVIGNYSGGFTSSNDLTVTLTSLATPSAVAALLNAVSYVNVGDDPGSTTRTLRFVLTDGTGESSVPVDRTVNVTPVNDIPLLTASSGSVAYVENAAAVVVDSALQVRDPDSPDFSGGTLTASFQSGQAATDRLVFVTDATVSVSGNQVLVGGTVVGTFTGGYTSNAALVVTLNASATRDAVQTLARSVGFRVESENPTTTNRVVKFVVTDGDGGTSAAATRSLTVTAVNDVPVITPSIAVTSYTENAVPVTVDGSIKVTDPDSTNFDTGVLTVSIASGASAEDRLRITNQGTAAGKIGLSGSTVLYGNVAMGTYSGGFTDNSAITVTLNAKATPAAVTALMKAISFEATGDTPTAGNRVLQFQVTDGDGGTSLAAQKTLKVNAVNDVPVITPSSGSASYLENDPGVLVDPAISLADIDSADFATGTLKTSISSGVVSTDRLFIASEGTGAGQVGVSGSNITYGSTVVGTFTGGVTTSGALTITFNGSATPAIAQAVARRLSFRNAGDNPTAGTRTISFVLTDGDGGTSAAKTRQVAVTPVNDGPVIGAIGAAVSYTEGTVAGTLITSTATVTDPDSSNFDTGTLTVSLPVGVSANDLLEIRNVGVAAGQIGVTGANVTYGGVTIGSYTGGSGSTPLVVTFNATATAPMVQALMRAITFRTTGVITTNSSRTVRFSLTDGDGGTSLDAEKQINVINI